MTAPERFAKKVRFALAPRAPSIHDPFRHFCRIICCGATIALVRLTLTGPEVPAADRDFAAVVKAAGKPVELIEAANYNHPEMNESLASPPAFNGLAALVMMKLLSIG